MLSGENDGCSFCTLNFEPIGDSVSLALVTRELRKSVLMKNSFIGSELRRDGN